MVLTMSISSVKIDCSICLDTMPANTEQTVTPCNHTFHKVCLEKWLKRGDDCPICNRDLFEDISIEDVIGAVEQCRAKQLSESEMNQIQERYQRSQPRKIGEERRIEQLSIKQVKKEHAELKKLKESKSLNNFESMKFDLMEKRIKNEARNQKYREDFKSAAVAVAMCCLTALLPNAT